MLEAGSRDAWTEVLDAFRAVEASDETPRSSLSHIAAILLGSWR